MSNFKIGREKLQENKEQPLISIALKVYNGEKYLREFLDSIASQTYQNLEIIACDDHSTDNTVKILVEYSKILNLKYYINERRLGIVKNLEKALSLCNGSFIALADQDDIWIPKKIETLYKEIIRDNNILCVLSDAYVIDANGNVMADSFINHIGVDNSTEFIDFLFGSKYPGSTFLIRRELLDFALPYPENVAEDWWLNIIASKKGKVKFLDKKLIMYRLHSSNTIGALKSTFKELSRFYILKGRKFMEDHQNILYSTLERLDKDLTPKEKEMIENLIKFNARKDKYISISSFLIFLKYFDRFAKGKKLHIKIIYMLSTLIGFKTLEKIFKVIE